jgi:hypothetical protein
VFVTPALIDGFSQTNAKKIDHWLSTAASKNFCESSQLVPSPKVVSVALLSLFGRMLGRCSFVQVVQFLAFNVRSSIDNASMIFSPDFRIPAGNAFSNVSINLPISLNSNSMNIVEFHQACFEQLEVLCPKFFSRLWKSRWFRLWTTKSGSIIASRVNLSEPDQNSLTWRQLASRDLLELSKTNRVLVPFVAILALLQLNLPSDLKQSVFSVKTKSRNSQALGSPPSHIQTKTI